jgi:hypothetical protein
MADDISLCTLVSGFRGLLGVFLGMWMDVGSLVWYIGIGIYWYVMAYMMKKMEQFPFPLMIAPDLGVYH